MMNNNVNVQMFKCGAAIASSTICCYLALRESIKQRRRAVKAEKELKTYKTALDLDWIVIDGQRKEYEEEIESLKKELKLAKHSGRYAWED